MWRSVGDGMRNWRVSVGANARSADMWDATFRGTVAWSATARTRDVRGAGARDATVWACDVRGADA